MRRREARAASVGTSNERHLVAWALSEAAISEVELSTKNEELRTGTADSPAPERIAVIQPYLNETGVTGNVARRLTASIPHPQIHVIDNGSTNGTADTARAAGAQGLLASTRGKGNVVRCAFTTIAAETCVIADGDSICDDTAAPRLIYLDTLRGPAGRRYG